MSSGSAPDPTRVFALSERTRFALLRMLSDGQTRSIAALPTDIRLTRRAVTEHLHVPENSGAVRSRCAGRETRFAYRPDPIVQARPYLHDTAARWDALSRLRAFVEE